MSNLFLAGEALTLAACCLPLDPRSLPLVACG